MYKVYNLHFVAGAVDEEYEQKNGRRKKVGRRLGLQSTRAEKVQQDSSLPQTRSTMTRSDHRGADTDQPNPTYYLGENIGSLLI